MSEPSKSVDDKGILTSLQTFDGGMVDDLDTMNMTLDNMTLPIEEEALQTFTKGLYQYGVPIICVVGILGNILSFRVFVFTSFSKQSSSLYIAALSLSDTCFLISLFLSWMGYGRIGIYYGHNPVWCHLMIYCTYVCSFLSVWYVVLIMVDRYIVVCRSLHVPEWCTKKRARIATSVVTVFGMLLYAHTFLTVEIMGENCANQFKPFMLNLLFIFIYADTAVTFIIPFAIIFFLNIIVIMSMKKFQIRHLLLKDRKITSTSPLNVISKAQFKITRTFILLSIVMLVTNVPSHGIRFYIMVKNIIQNDKLFYAQHMFQIVYYFNFSVNFLLYSASSKRFRKHTVCRQVCRRCRRSRDNHAELNCP